MAKLSSRGAERLAALVSSGQYSQRQVAERVGTTQPVVSRWVSGARVPSGAYLAAIEREFGIPVAEWFGSEVAPATGTEG